VHHASLQILGDAAWQIARLGSTVAQGGTLRAGTAAFGGDYSRLRADTVLAGRGAHGDLYAGYFGSGSQLLDFRTFQDHVAPDTTSNLLFKGAVADKSASVYTGLIKIRPDARGSQAFQTNRNLKLSDDAWAESVPNLEQRFYLESRGVPTDRAERLIVKGVFDEVFRALPLGPFESAARARLDRELERSMA
jgi:Fe-S cluster assembly protein SufD